MDKDMGSLDKAVIRYLLSVMKDPKAATVRRDKAAGRLTQHLNVRRRFKQKLIRDRKSEAKMIRKEERQIARKAEKRTQQAAERAAKGKKAVHRVAAVETAQNSDWADLIPKAEVVSINRKRV
jgi:hypothetical protein